MIYPPRKDERCRNKVVFHASQRTGGGQTVLLSGGPAAELLIRYIEEAKRTKRSIELEQLKVVFLDKGGRQVEFVGVKPTIGDLIRGRNHRLLWVDKLKNMRAERLGDPERNARMLGSDLVCGSS